RRGLQSIGRPAPSSWPASRPCGEWFRDWPGLSRRAVRSLRNQLFLKILHSCLDFSTNGRNNQEWILRTNGRSFPWSSLSPSERRLFGSHSGSCGAGRITSATRITERTRPHAIQEHPYVDRAFGGSRRRCQLRVGGTNKNRKPVQVQGYPVHGPRCAHAVRGDIQPRGTKVLRPGARIHVRLQPRRGDPRLPARRRARSPLRHGPLGRLAEPGEELQLPVLLAGKGQGRVEVAGAGSGDVEERVGGESGVD